MTERSTMFTYTVILVLSLIAIIGLIRWRAHNHAICEKKTCPADMVPKRTSEGCVCLRFAK